MMESVSDQMKCVLEYVLAQTAGFGFLPPVVRETKSGSKYYEFRHKSGSGFFKLRISTHDHPDRTDDIGLNIVVGAAEIDWARIDRKLRYHNPNVCSICFRKLEENEQSLCNSCCADGFNKLLENMRMDSPRISPTWVHHIFKELKSKAGVERHIDPNAT